MDDWKWKYEEMSDRCSMLREHVCELAESYTELMQKLKKAQDFREFLARKLVDVRMRRRQKMEARGPRNAFVLYCQERKLIMRRRYPTLGTTDIKKRLAQEWRTMSKDKRQVYYNDYRVCLRSIRESGDGDGDGDAVEEDDHADARRPVAMSKRARRGPSPVPAKRQRVRKVGNKRQVEDRVAAMTGVNSSSTMYENTAAMEQDSSARVAIHHKAAAAAHDEVGSPVVRSIPPAEEQDHDVDDLDDEVDEEDSASSVGGSDDDSDDHMASLPTGAFG